MASAAPAMLDGWAAHYTAGPAQRQARQTRQARLEALPQRPLIALLMSVYVLPTQIVHVPHVLLHRRQQYRSMARSGNAATYRSTAPNSTMAP